MHLSWIDYAIVLVYVGGTIIAGTLARGAIKGISDFLVAGRGLQGGRLRSGPPSKSLPRQEAKAGGSMSLATTTLPSLCEVTDHGLGS